MNEKNIMEKPELPQYLGVRVCVKNQTYDDEILPREDGRRGVCNY